MPAAVRISRARFTEMWLGHVHGDAIAAAFGIDRSTVTKFAKRFGLPLRTQRKCARWVIPFDRSDEFAAMWRAWVKTDEIARHFGCNCKTVENHAKRLGLPAKGRGNPERFLSLADFRALQLREAMARSAAETRAQMKLADMIDYFSGPRRAA